MDGRESASADSPVWDRDALRDPHRQQDKPQRVQAMFDAIAPTYERINSLATFGRDAVWRRRAVVAAEVRPGDVVLDVACGTGDMLRVFARLRPLPGRLIGVDFATRMLTHGRYDRLPVPVEIIQADALHLPLPDESADVISCAFGVRNFQDLHAGLREMYRVARPGARVVILEFALPTNRLLRRLYAWYCAGVLPWLGRLVARDRTGAYEYLCRSVETFPPPEALVTALRQVGFADVRVQAMNFGGVVLYRARKGNQDDAAPGGRDSISP